MRPISEATARVTGQTCSRKYIALGRIVNSWVEIVGEELAQKAHPVRMNYSKPGKSGPPSAILEIASTPSDATLLHYQKDLILERINRLFGAGWLTGIKFVTIPSSKAMLKPRRSTKKVLTTDQKNYLSGVLDLVGDTEIKSLLNNLGENIMMESAQ